MRRTAILTTGLLAALVLSGCTPRTTADKAQMDRRYTDKPATLMCFDYGQPIYTGRSVGKPQRSDTGEGSWSFVDASNNKLTTVEANCHIVYD